MHVYLIQHAKAKTKDEDPQRGLTDEGIAEAQKCFAFFSRQDPKVDFVWHSGKRRAAQTAELLSGRLGFKGIVSEHASLSPNDDVREIAGVLRGSDRETAIVGHMPHLARLASFLLSGDESRVVIRFRNAGVVCLEKDESGWRLCWMVTPELVSEEKEAL